MAANSRKPRVMVCAKVLVAGMAWPRLLYELLEHAACGDYQLVLSVFAVDEAREMIDRLSPDLTPQFEAVLQCLEHELVPAATSTELAHAPYLTRNSEDLPLMLAAVKAQVDLLVSHDSQLTDPSLPAHRYLKVVLPATFLRQTFGWSAEELQGIHSRTWQVMAHPAEV